MQLQEYARCTDLGITCEMRWIEWVGSCSVLNLQRWHERVSLKNAGAIAGYCANHEGYRRLRRAFKVAERTFVPICCVCDDQNATPEVSTPPRPEFSSFRFSPFSLFPLSTGTGGSRAARLQEQLACSLKQLRYRLAAFLL